jgi:predicted HTH domain antitoxin
MPLTIGDEQLQAMKMSPEEARIEIACRLFDAEKLGFHEALRLAGLDRFDFEDALGARGIAIYRPTIQDFHDDLAALRRMGV